MNYIKKKFIIQKKIYLIRDQIKHRFILFVFITFYSNKIQSFNNYKIKTITQIDKAQTW